ncbi:MAG: hypothetical protein AB7D51_12640 [Desulfovibrionaceae bacterium]
MTNSERDDVSERTIDRYRRGDITLNELVRRVLGPGEQTDNPGDSRDPGDSGDVDDSGGPARP